METVRCGTGSLGKFSTLLGAVLLAALSLPADVGAQSSAAPRYTFTVELEGIAVGSFREVSGIGIETEAIEFREGGTTVIRKLPGRTKWPDIVLKRGFTGNTELYDWATTVARTGAVVRRSGSIVMHTAAGTPVARWNFQNAWPAKWEGPTLNSSGNEVAIETLILVHEGLSLADEAR